MGRLHAVSGPVFGYVLEGEYEHALTYARKQLELEPWDEPAHCQLMRALALNGQRSAALAQYETCRRVLADELGAEPTEETTTLYEQIKAGTVASDAQRKWSPPATPLIGREAGYRKRFRHVATKGFFANHGRLAGRHH